MSWAGLAVVWPGHVMDIGRAAIGWPWDLLAMGYADVGLGCPCVCLNIFWLRMGWACSVLSWTKAGLVMGFLAMAVRCLPWL